MRLLGLLLVAATAHSAAADPKPAHGATRVTIDYKYRSFHHSEHHYVIEWKSGTGYRVNKRTVEARVIDGLYAALTDLRATDHSLQCISHTDDYPAYTVTIDGDQPLVIASTSNCHDNVPWNVTVKGTSHAQFNGDAGRAVEALLVAVDPEQWKTEDSPEASMSFGGEQVELDEYTGQASSQPAALCAASLEANPHVQQALGEAVRVKGLDLRCSLTRTDCESPTALASFVWDGVNATVELACPSGKIDASPSALASLRDLHAFVESKPVRTLVRLSSKPPRMWNMRSTWALEGDFQLPRLDYDQHAAQIEARSSGDSGPSGGTFWTELGLDAGKLTHKLDDHDFETTAKIDLAGHLVK